MDRRWAPITDCDWMEGIMSLLEFGPRSWFSGRVYGIVQDGTPIGEIDCAWLREQGTIKIGSAGYTASREGLASGAFFLEANGTHLISAEKPSALHRLFTVQIGGRAYTLKGASTFGRAFVLTESDREVGSIAPQGFFGRKAKANLPDDLSLEVRAFLIWLVIIMWKREAKAAKSSSSSSNN
jgi:hypothetical protein